MTAPAFLTLSTTSDAERVEIERLSQALALRNAAYSESEKRYDGTFAAEQFGISIPPSMRGLMVVAGWPGTAVDAIEERLDLLGWSAAGDDDFGLSSVFADNTLDVDSGMSHLDALIFGTAFVTVGTGYVGEPHPLIVPHSPKTMVARWDSRLRRASSALSEVAEDGSATQQTLYLPGETLTVEIRGNRLAVVDRDQHKLGRVLVVPLVNRERASALYGFSEITNAVRYYTDAAARTLLGMEVNREFYSSPQRVALNVDEKSFRDPAGNVVSQWSAIMGRVWAIPPNEDGSQPSVQQFTPASPAPYLDQVRGLAQLLAAEVGIPSAYLGFTTDNPASADAIRAGEARLVKRAERRQRMFGRAWTEVARLALMVRDGSVPDNFASTIRPNWRDAATPTRAAAADEVTKLVGAGIIPADSTVAMDRVGLSPAEQRSVIAVRANTPAAITT